MTGRNSNSNRIPTMYISLVNGLSDGSTKWSAPDRPYDNDDDNGDAPQIPIADPPADTPPIDDPAATHPEQPHHPWLVPGAGSSF